VSWRSLFAGPRCIHEEGLSADLAACFDQPSIVQQRRAEIVERAAAAAAAVDAHTANSTRDELKRRQSDPEGKRQEGTTSHQTACE